MQRYFFNNNKYIRSIFDSKHQLDCKAQWRFWRNCFFVFVFYLLVNAVCSLHWVGWSSSLSAIGLHYYACSRGLEVFLIRGFKYQAFQTFAFFRASSLHWNATYKTKQSESAEVVCAAKDKSSKIMKSVQAMKNYKNISRTTLMWQGHLEQSSFSAGCRLFYRKFITVLSAT